MLLFACRNLRTGLSRSMKRSLRAYPILSDLSSNQSIQFHREQIVSLSKGSNYDRMDSSLAPENNKSSNLSHIPLKQCCKCCCNACCCNACCSNARCCNACCQKILDRYDKIIHNLVKWLDDFVTVSVLYVILFCIVLAPFVVLYFIYKLF